MALRHRRAMLRASLNPIGSYGYQWWAMNDAYFNRAVSGDIKSAIGLHGQRLKAVECGVVLTKLKAAIRAMAEHKIELSPGRRQHGWLLPLVSYDLHAGRAVPLGDYCGRLTLYP